MADPELTRSDAEIALYQREVRVSARVMMILGLLAQIGAAAGTAALWQDIDGSAEPLLVGMAAFLLACVFHDLCLWRKIRQPDFDAADLHERFFQIMLWIGAASAIIWSVVGIFVLARLSTFAITALSIGLMLLIFVALLLDAVKAHVGSTLTELMGERVQVAWWWSIGAGMVFFPLTLGWAAASVTMPLMHEDRFTVRAWLDENTPAKKTCEPWEHNGERIRVAVTLSGGGYRAALTHAGVLAALDVQCVPINLLSTVSGGSIVGAAYALGVPPKEFASRLIRQKPGLPNARLNMVNIAKSNSRVYREHLEKTFFGTRTLHELPNEPRLLLNATNLYTSPAYARYVLEKTWPYGYADRDTEPRIADAVAASAAFPGVFTPIDPQLGSGKDRVKSVGRLLLDGGVIENFGIDGLRQRFFDTPISFWEKERPSLIIISDATGYAGDGERMVINPAADEVLIRASAVQYDNLHRLILGEVTGRYDLPHQIQNRDAWEQYYVVDYPKNFLPSEVPVPVPKLSSVLIPMTARATGQFLKIYPECRNNGPILQERVSQLPTLRELTAEEARDAFLLGYTLGKIYGQAIECARRNISGASCTEPPESTETVCPDDVNAIFTARG